MDIQQELAKLMSPDRVKTRYIDRVTYGSDAGFYYLLPKAVVQPAGESEIIRLFALSHRLGIPLVFRCGGTSLSGQSITDGILVDLSRHWGQVIPSGDGRTVRLGPGVTGASVNARLRAWSRKIGPDPSSIAAAMMGGILSNNASGMCCGVMHNAYHTLKDIRFILPDGKVFDTSLDEDFPRFLTECPGIARELTALRTMVSDDPGLRDRIRRKYQMKNTVGYSINALADYEHPLDILAHLLIGAEGTLAFISSATLITIPQQPCRATGMLYFPDMHAACRSIPALKAAGAEAVELMDRASLRAVENIPGMPAVLKGLPAEAAALLVEFQAADPASLNDQLDRFLGSASIGTVLHYPEFTQNHVGQDLLWKVRKGLFPSVGAVRKSGTTVILEDIAFPVERLGDAIQDLRALFAEFGYDDAIIFGHAKDGNIHFVIRQSFGSAAEINRYAAFIGRLVPLVVEKYDGALKAEHGTGRNMAPFVETEWGPDAYAIMKRLKACIDPLNLLNPGVIITPDRDKHIRDLKEMPEVEPEVDKCIECGYCEHVCPSRDLTMTPRRRIVARRALRLLDVAGDREHRRELLHQFRYDGLDTCAVDGLCATACPVDINTGDLVKRLRRENHSAFANRVALLVARNFSAALTLARTGVAMGLVVNRCFGGNAMTGMTRFFRRLFPSMPVWPRMLGLPPRVLHPGCPEDSGPRIVYHPSCVSRMLKVGGAECSSVMETLMSVSVKAGVGVILPEAGDGLCCGQLFSSKGFPAAHRYAADRLIARLWELTEQGRWPVVTDVSSCTYTLLSGRGHLSPASLEKFDRLRILDVVGYLHDIVLPRAHDVRQTGPVVLHPVCSVHKMGNLEKLIAVARKFSAAVTVPQHAGCCGMAGDRGFFFPELTRTATRQEAVELEGWEFAGHYSSAVSCELALSEATGKRFASVLELADKAMSLQRGQYSASC